MEVNCETDFVAKRPEFAELAKSVAMQIAACPTVEAISIDDISQEWIEKEKKVRATDGVVGARAAWAVSLAGGPGAECASILVLAVCAGDSCGCLPPTSTRAAHLERGAESPGVCGCGFAGGSRRRPTVICGPRSSLRTWLRPPLFSLHPPLAAPRPL